MTAQRVVSAINIENIETLVISKCYFDCAESKT